MKHFFKLVAELVKGSPKDTSNNRCIYLEPMGTGKRIISIVTLAACFNGSAAYVNPYVLATSITVGLLLILLPFFKAHSITKNSPTNFDPPNSPEDKVKSDGKKKKVDAKQNKKNKDKGKDQRKDFYIIDDESMKDFNDNIGIRFKPQNVDNEDSNETERNNNNPIYYILNLSTTNRNTKRFLVRSDDDTMNKQKTTDQDPVKSLNFRGELHETDVKTWLDKTGVLQLSN